MSDPNDSVRLQHMLDHAREALLMVRGRKRSDLDRDRQLNLSLVRLLRSSVKPPHACPSRHANGVGLLHGQRLWA